MPKIPAERIVIRSPNWLGDAMMCTPAVNAIRQIYPQGHIAIITKSSLIDLWKFNPAINEVIELPKSRSLNNILVFSKSLSLKQFDIGILFTNSISSTLEMYLGKVENRIGYGSGLRSILLTHSMNSENNSTHFIHEYLGLVKVMGEMSTSNAMTFTILPEWKNRAGELFVEHGISDADFVVGLNPGAAFGTAKRWLPGRFIELANRLTQEKNAKIVLFGGSNEVDDIQKFAEKINSQTINLAGKTSLGELAACISKCNLFVTNDSGPMHVAAALKVPLVSIFGSTNMKATGPIGTGKTEIIHHQPKCAPCLLRECPIDHRCMTAISVDDVFDSCIKVIS